MRRLLWPSVTTVLMLVVLIGLGVWQLQRREWKADILARISAAEVLPAVPLPADPSLFAKVHIDGHLRTDLVALYGAEVRADTLGAQVIVPLERDHADPVLVDLGWAPNERRGPLVFPQNGVDGYIRPAEHEGTFSGKDDPAKRLFYTLDPALIGAALGFPRVAPFTLVVMGPSTLGVFPDPVQTMPRPPDNHLQYAITWFSFAVTLLIIFFLYARKTLRT